MRSVHFVLVAVLGLAGQAALGQSSHLGATVRLGAGASAGTDGDEITFQVSSPYPERGVQILATSPTGSQFPVASGVTNGQGAWQVTVGLIGDGASELNGVFQAVVEGEPGKMGHASSSMLLELGDSDRAAAFVRREEELLSGRAALAAGFADVDADGDEDLITVSSGPSEGPSIDLLLNDGAGILAAAPEARLEAPLLAGRVVAVADADGDGDLDFFVGTAESESENALFINNGAGFFSRAASFAAKAGEGVRSNAALFADVDADGDADLLVANGITGSHAVPAVPQPSQLLLNDGLGSFSESAAYKELGLDPAVSRAVAAGDVDLDGDLDLLVGNAGVNWLLLNDGTGFFENRSEQLPEAADSTYGVALEDVDLDGDLDVLYSNTMFNPAAQVLLLNQGGPQGGKTGSFEVGGFPSLAPGQSPIRLGIQAVDVDADGDIDVLFPIHELGNAERPDLYLNQGGRQGGEAGSFVLEAAFAVAPGIYSAIPAADVDGDGDLDLVELSGGTTDPEAGGPTNRVLLNQLFEAPNPPLGFQRGDANLDQSSNLSDALFILNYLFLGGAAPGCLRAADVNASDTLDLSDPVSLLNYLFLGGQPPAAPFPAFGDDPAPVILSCERVEIFEVVR